MVPNQEPVRVITQHHLEVVVTVLVALLSQLPAMTEHVQVKKTIQLVSYVYLNQEQSEGW